MKKLGDLLLEKGIITKENLDESLKIQAGGVRRLGEILVSLELVTEERLVDVLSEQPGVAKRSIATFINSKILPRYMCKKFMVYPLEKNGKVLNLAMIDPMDLAAIDEIENYTQCTVNPLLVKKSELDDCIKSVSLTVDDFVNPDNILSVFKYVLIGFAIMVVCLVGLVSKKQYDKSYGRATQIEHGMIYDNLDLSVQTTDDGKVKFQGHGLYSSGVFSVDLDNMDALKIFIDAKSKLFSKEQLEWLNTIVKK